MASILPTTSSIIAAVVSTTPNRVTDSPLVAMTVKVVPRLVEHRAAPAAKACSGVAPTKPTRAYESAIGTVMPVRATPAERDRFAFSALKDVERPPSRDDEVSEEDVDLCWRLPAFVYKQYQPQIPEINNHGFRIFIEPAAAWCAPRDPKEYLTQKTT